MNSTLSLENAASASVQAKERSVEVSFVTLNEASVKVCKAQKLFPGGRGWPLSHPLDIGREITKPRNDTVDVWNSISVNQHQWEGGLVLDCDVDAGAE